MELSEEKQLNEITEAFAGGVQLLQKRDYTKALKVFNTLSETYKDSEYYSVAEIQGRSQVYRRICEHQLNPPDFRLEADEDYLFDGTYHLNAGNPEKALESLNQLKDKGFKDPYLSYLLSLVYLKMSERDSSMECLQKAIEGDEFYKVIAHNEPDFEPMFEDERFVQLIDTGEESEQEELAE